MLMCISAVELGLPGSIRGTPCCCMLANWGCAWMTLFRPDVCRLLVGVSQTS